MRLVSELPQLNESSVRTHVVEPMLCGTPRKNHPHKLGLFPQGRTRTVSGVVGAQEGDTSLPTGAELDFDKDS